MVIDFNRVKSVRFDLVSALQKAIAEFQPAISREQTIDALDHLSAVLSLAEQDAQENHD